MAQKDVNMRIADNDIDKVRFQKLLYDTYAKRLGWLDANNYPQKRVTDQYDNISDIILIMNGAELVGGSRITKLSNGPLPHAEVIDRSLPLLEQSNKKLYDEISGTAPEKTAEINRMIAVGRTHLFVLTQAKSMMWYILQYPVEVLYAVIDVQLFTLCDRIDFPLRPIGIPEYCEGSWTVPVAILRRDLLTPTQKGYKYWQSDYNDAIVGVS